MFGPSALPEQLKSLYCVQRCVYAYVHSGVPAGVYAGVWVRMRVCVCMCVSLIVDAFVRIFRECAYVLLFVCLKVRPLTACAVSVHFVRCVDVWMWICASTVHV